MALGNIVALAQTSMKRMLAYSSIGQAGFVMIGIVSGTQDGLSAAVLYLAAYLFMNLGAFSCVILFSLRTGSDRILDYSGLCLLYTSPSPRDTAISRMPSSA